jgi:hypothetical protein
MAAAPQGAGRKSVNCDAFQGQVGGSDLILASQRRYTGYQPLPARSGAAGSDLT